MSLAGKEVVGAMNGATGNKNYNDNLGFCLIVDPLCSLNSRFYIILPGESPADGNGESQMPQSRAESSFSVIPHVHDRKRHDVQTEPCERNHNIKVP